MVLLQFEFALAVFQVWQGHARHSAAHVDEAEMVNLALCSTMQVHEIVDGRRLRIPVKV